MRHWTLLHVVGVVSAASLEEPHFHRGRLSPYTLSKPNLLISSSDEQRLRHGESVMQAVAAADGSGEMRGSFPRGVDKSRSLWGSYARSPD